MYSRYILPWVIDWACSRPQQAEHRQKVIPLASGKVLEVGIGSGMNLDVYSPEKVTHLYAVDPMERLWKRRKHKLEGLSFELSYSPVSAENLPYGDAFFDTVVSTSTLCSVKDIRSVLSEIYRVLKPEGKYVFYEHGLAPDEKLAGFQRRLNPFWKRIGGGCNLDRDIAGLLEAAGFSLSGMEEGYQDVWRATSYHYWGWASKKSNPPVAP